MPDAPVDFEIFTEKDIHQQLFKKKLFKIVSPFFLLVKSGNINLNSEVEDEIQSNTISVFSKERNIDHPPRIRTVS